ncbi:serum response factor-binding protein 1 isoform X2 [Peromyscus californicus insignis]|uniref:serum response factor-binding protein 1 isoform X2 n=1 Tax=Peromyscus californicus insignis TaxID=564181 RepID=UPI0022A7A8B0|nr:serum response factor-binding protein 1 isoform X2 [Peromyscus californicus insignis]
MAADPLPPSAMARPGTLNLNNEVVKMRKEVKRVRVLVIRKLVRSVGRLKSKKGTEDALLKNQRRAQRLLEEIHAMKELKPDVITKSALDDDINFEKTCKKPDSTATERAIARLAVHPLLKKKIDVLKAAVQAFKDARQNAPEAGSSKNTSEENQCKDTLGSKDDARQLQHHERTVVSEQRGKDAKTVAKKAVSDSKERMAKIEDGAKAVATPCSPGIPSGKDAVVTSAHQKAPADANQKASTKSTKRESESTPGGSSGSEEELSEEEKEYFDDSTEERFYKQSSVSEDSDSGDDFFIGKVKRTRKRDCSLRSSAKDQKPLPKMSPKTNTLETNWGVRNDQHKRIPEARKLESVFFHSLSGPKSSRRDSREQVPKNKAPDFPEDEPPIKSQFTKSAGRRFESRKQQDPAPLHPSWEASRRRKEQQSKITVFQGKKITFDD